MSKENVFKCQRCHREKSKMGLNLLTHSVGEAGNAIYNICDFCKSAYAEEEIIIYILRPEPGEVITIYKDYYLEKEIEGEAVIRKVSSPVEVFCNRIAYVVDVVFTNDSTEEVVRRKYLSFQPPGKGVIRDIDLCRRVNKVKVQGLTASRTQYKGETRTGRHYSKEE